MAWVDITDGEGGLSVRNKLNELGQTALVSGTRIQKNDLGTFFTTATQDPTGDGSAGKIRVNFGAGGSTVGGEFTVAGDGTITTDIGDVSYELSLVLRTARVGAGANAIPMARVLYSADGSETDTVQLGLTFSVLIDNANTVWRNDFTFSIAPATDSRMWVELARDEAGNDSSGLAASQPTGTLLTDTPAWNAVPSASISMRAIVAA